MKNDNFRGELTDISAKMEALLRTRLHRGVEVTCKATRKHTILPVWA